MRFRGGKNPKIADFGHFFSSAWGGGVAGRWGAEPLTGGKMPPCPH